MSKSKTSKSGFTLLEILLVVGIIAILAGIVIVAINPSKQIATVRNTQRQSDIKQINSALQQYFIDHGSYPPSILDATTLTEICDTDDAPAPSGVTCTNLVDLSVLVPTYLAAIPKDPNATTTNYAGYKVIKGPTTGLISLGAPLAELGQSIVLGKEAGGGGAGVDLGEGLMAHWTMNDSVADSVGGYNGTWSNDEVYIDSMTGMGKAASFDGSDDKIILGAVDELKLLDTSFSISMWLYEDSNSYSSFPGILGSAAWSGEGTGYYMHTGSTEWGGDEQKKRILFGGAGLGSVTAEDCIDFDTWNHVVVTYQLDGDIKIYCDGALNNTAASEGRMADFIPYISIGKGWDDSDNRIWKGGIDDVRFYDRALTQEEVTALVAGTEAE